MLRLIPPPLHRLALRIAQPLRKRWWRLTKPDLQGVSIIGCDPRGQVLMVRLAYGSGEWQFPGGGIKREEAPEAAARRELQEEAGCSADGLKEIARFEEIVFGARCDSWLFAGNILTQPRADGREVVEARFFPRHSLPMPISNRAQKRLAMWREAQRNTAA